MRFPFLKLADVNAPYADEIAARVGRVIASGRYIGGPENEEFEERLARMTGVPYAVGLSNGLDALRLILRANILLGRLKEGDEVIVPANTYIASVLAITDSRLKPVPAEPLAATSNLDTSRLEEYLTPRTRAVMTVHLYGRVAWDKTLEEFIARHNLVSVEDNAQAIGASVSIDGHRRRTGALAQAAAFSFYPTKNIGAMGDAGAVTTADARLADAVRALANYGADRRYHNLYAGFNCRLDPVQAAVLNVKLPHTDAENQLRRDIANVYLSEINNPELTLPTLPADPAEMVWHQFVVHTPHRKRFTDFMEVNEIGYDIHYATPPHLQPCYAGWDHGPLPVTERLADTCVSLPVSRLTTLDDARQISRIINGYSG